MVEPSLGILITGYILAVGIAFLAGQSRAANTTYYYVKNNAVPEVALMFVGDNVIMAPYDSQKMQVDRIFRIYPINSDNLGSLKLIYTGRLQPKD